MALTNIQDAIAEWVETTLALKPYNMSVFWENQNAPRPPLPYVGLNIISMTRLCKDFVEHLDSDGNALITALHAATLNISCFHTKDGGNMEAVGVLDYLRLSLTKPSVTDFLNDHKVTLISANTAINYLPAHIATGFEPRATMDVHLGFTTSTSDYLGLIEEIRGRGTMANVEIDYSTSNEK